MAVVLCYTTGGTIASRYDPEVDGFVPVLSGAELLEAIGDLGDGIEPELVELANLSSTFLTPEMVFDWSQRIAADLRRDDVIGAVVAHGTDTLEESAYLLDLTIAGPKPVVVTGAMRTSSELQSDGARNLQCAFRVAAHPDARDLGVLVVLAEQIHAAQDVTKLDAEALAAFQSPDHGQLGRVSRGWGRDDVRIERRPRRREHIATERIEPRVAYVKTVMGCDGAPIDAAVAAGAQGIVIEAFGGGEITPFQTDAVERALAAGVQIVVATRAVRGRPMDLYAELGEGKWLRDRGVHFAGDLTGPKARVKLMLALGAGDPDRLARAFDMAQPSTRKET